MKKEKLHLRFGKNPKKQLEMLRQFLIEKSIEMKFPHLNRPFFTNGDENVSEEVYQFCDSNNYSVKEGDIVELFVDKNQEKTVSLGKFKARSHTKPSFSSKEIMQIIELQQP